MKVERSPYSFQPLKQEHFDLLHRWLNEPHVAERWGGKCSRDAVEEKYRPALVSSSVFRFIVSVEKGIEWSPIGFIQYYLVEEASDAWWPGQPAGTVGIDQFIGEADLLDLGHGSAFIDQFVTELLATPGIRRVLTDPAPDNTRALRCYEKAGFERLGPVSTPDGDAVLMLRCR